MNEEVVTVSQTLIEIDPKCSRCKIITPIPYFLDDEIIEHESFKILSINKNNIYCKRCYAITFTICINRQREFLENKIKKRLTKLKIENESNLYGVNNKINNFVTDEYLYDISESECQCILVINEKAIKCKNEYNIIMSDIHGFEKYYCCICYNNEKTEYEKDKNYDKIYFREKNATKNILKEKIEKEKIRQKILNKNIRKIMTEIDKVLEDNEQHCELLLDEVIDKKMLQAMKDNIDYKNIDQSPVIPENIKKYYIILDIPLILNLNIVKKAYYTLSLLYHPDKNVTDTKIQFQNVNEAYRGIVEWIELNQ